MITRRLRPTVALVITTLAFAPACGDDASPAPTPPPPSGGAGAAGNARAGSAGSKLAAGAAGTGNTQAGTAGSGGKGGPSGGSGGAGGQGSGGAAGQGTGASSGAAGTSAGAGGAVTAGAAGSMNTAGTSAYPTDANPGPNVIPTSCALAHGPSGCCGPDGNAYRYDYDEGVVKNMCPSTAPCGWLNSPGTLRFDCGGEAELPFAWPIAATCGAPAIPGRFCPESICTDDAGCDPTIWGAGARCRVFGENGPAGYCVRCETDADCPADRFCDPEGGGICLERFCDTDAECASKNPSLPACGMIEHTCVPCTQAKHCPGVGMGCFVDGCGCKEDTACVDSPYGHRCNAIEHVCGCKEAADCPASAPVCIDGGCSTCASDLQCKTKKPSTPYCVARNESHDCVACRKDTDCAAPGKPWCVDGVCLPGCQTSFTCPPNAPVCTPMPDGSSACSLAPACVDDDDHEAGDDNPLTATMKLETGAPIAGKMCGLPGERDHFQVVLTQAGDVILTVSSSTPEIFVSLSDASGRLLGLSIHGKPQSLRVRALAAGTYYAAVGLAVDDGTSASVAYSIERTGGATLCTSDASCGDVQPTEIYRGRCDPPTGACMFIEGNQNLGPAEPCDDDTDCKTGFCSDYAFAGRPGVRSRCSAPCDGPGPLGQVPSSELCSVAGLDGKWICTTFEDVNRCLPRCASDDDCPLVDLLAAPPPGKAWLHMTCNPKGECEHFD